MNEPKLTSFEFDKLPDTMAQNGPAPALPPQEPKRRGRKPGSANKRTRTRQVLTRAVEAPQTDRRKLVLQAIQILSALDKNEQKFVVGLFA